jgi:hypothetical protein
LETIGGATILDEGIEYRCRLVGDKVTQGGKPRTLEIDFDVPVTLEDSMNVLIANANTNTTITTTQRR